jgi:hypothetical protein
MNENCSRGKRSEQLRFEDGVLTLPAVNWEGEAPAEPRVQPLQWVSLVIRRPIVRMHPSKRYLRNSPRPAQQELRPPTFNGISPNDQQRKVWHQIEDDYLNLEQAEEAIHGHIESLPRNGKPPALRAVHHVGGQEKYDAPKSQQRHIEDCAPHEEIGQRLNVHDFAPLLGLWPQSPKE